MESLGAISHFAPLYTTIHHLATPVCHERSSVEQTRLTREELADLLREAEQAHAEYERELGERDEDWPSWYAGYIVEKLEAR
jgi:hypothetical protein